MTLPVEKDGLEEDASDAKKASLKAARGPLLALAATILYAFSAEFTALASKGGIPGFQLPFFLRLTQIPMLLVCVLILRPKLIGENRKQNGLLLLDSVVSTFAIALEYLSFTYAPPGIAFGIIQGSVPLFTACIGFIFLKEKIDLIASGGILVSIIGVALVGVGMVYLETNSAQATVVSYLLPLAAALAKAPDMVLSRAILNEDISIITLALYPALVGTLAILICTYTFETPVWIMSAETAGYVAGLGLSQSIAMLLFMVVVKVEKVAIAVGLRTLVIPITILLDYFILSKVPNSLKWAGLCLVILGTLVLNIHTWWTHRQDERRMVFLKRMDFTPLQSDNEEIS